MSDTMTEGTIAAWHKQVGDKVKSGDVLAEVETDKATMDLESYSDGVLLHIGIKNGESVPVDGIIAIVGAAGEDVSGLLNGSSTTTAVPAATPSVQTEAAVIPNTTSTPTAIDTSSIKAQVIRMPKMSDTMTEGTIVSWQKKVGDKVKAGELLAEVETDKATMELESYESGTLLYIGVEAGNAVLVDNVIAIVGEEGADFNALLQADQNKTTATAATPAPVATNQMQAAVAAPASVAPVAVSSSDEHLKASPLARKMAEEKGLNLKEVQGTGENGRIIRRDIEQFTPQTKVASTTSATVSTAPVKAQIGVESYDEQPVSQMRKVIARRLSESLFTAPHFYLTMEINMDKAMEARKSINEYAESKISFNDLVVKAVAASLRKHPKVNSSWLGDKIRFNHHIHIGIAVAVEEGLLVPVIRFADNKSLSEISSETKTLANKAKNKQLQPAEWEGNTFTISNLGMFGIDEFTAIINPPDACILAVGGIKETVAFKNGVAVPTNVMKVTLSCDHRVVDGAVGSAFLQTLKALIEDPIRILA